MIGKHEGRSKYTVIVFQENDKTLKYKYVSSLAKFARMLNVRFPSWKYMNVYNRKSGIFIKRFYKGNYIPDHVDCNFF